MAEPRIAPARKPRSPKYDIARVMKEAGLV